MSSLREKLGLGLGTLRNENENEEKEIAEQLTEAVKNQCSTPKRNRFHSMMANTVTSIMMDLVAPWISECFEKYTESEFHWKMHEGRFDFIKDWQDNHPEEYSKFISRCRTVNKMGMLTLDHYAIYNVVMKMFDKKGWEITDFERLRLLETILQLIAEICK